MRSSFKSESNCFCVGKRCVHSNTLNVLFEVRSSESEWAEVGRFRGYRCWQGFHCEVGHGMDIPNQGEMKCVAMTEDSEIL